MNARLLLLPLALLAVAADWTRFRGPNGTGHASDKDVPVKWTDKNVLWKAPLDAAGHSSPIVVKGNVFLLGATKDERQVICLDVRTGKSRWVKKVPGGVSRIHPKSSYASSTPCSDGTNVYCAFWDGKKVGLYAYDFDGKLLWERDLGEFKSQHGHGFSPIVHEGLVIVNNDQDGSSHLQAFHAKDGKPAWTTPRKAFRACYSTPFLLPTQDGSDLVVTSTAGVTRYDPATGKERWNFTWKFSKTKALRTVGSAVAGDGMLFLGSGDGDGSRAMIAMKLEGTGDVSKSARLWETATETDSPYVPSLLFDKGNLYTVTDRGAIVCYEGKSGKESWKEARLAGNVSGSPVLIDGKIYAIDERGTVHVVAARPDRFELLARNKLGEGVLSSPAVANGRLYVRGDKHLFCVGNP